MYTQNVDAISGTRGYTGGVTQAGATMFPDPYADIASLYLPENIIDAFELVEYLMTTMPPFKAVTQRVVRYFLTSINIDGASDSNKEKYDSFFNDKLHIMQQLGEIGEDFACYGNSFVSVYMPFDRMLRCPECGTEYNSKKVDYKFDPRSMKMSGKCAKCHKEVTFERRDIKSTDTDRVRIVRWNPKYMDLRTHPISGKTEYFMRLEERFVEKIKSGDAEDRFYLDETPWEFIETCCKKTSNTIPEFEFNDDSIYHMKSTALAGIRMRGWGMPPMLPFFKLAYYIQLMRRYDEAIALDFIVPFRVIFPQNTAPGGQDALTTISMQTFTAAMQEMVARKRKNMTDVQIAPFSIGYQMLGGEGRQLTPKDSIMQAMQELLNAMGYPQELYQGNLSVQAAPTALRLFEKQWQPLVDGFNDIIAWIVKKVSGVMQWDNISAKLQSVTLADDIQRNSILMQAAGAMDISKGTAYNSIGIDYMKEQDRIVTEQQQIQRLQQDAMAAQQAQQANGDAGASAQGGPGGVPGATPGDVWEQAGEIAKQLLLQTPPTQVRGELIKIKQSNPTLHSMVKQRMEEMRSDMRSQGQAMVMDQARQQQ